MLRTASQALMTALAQAEQHCKAAGLQQKPVVEGQAGSDWQVVDLGELQSSPPAVCVSCSAQTQRCAGDTVAHLLLADARSQYAIEQKWQRLVSDQQPPEQIWAPS